MNIKPSQNEQIEAFLKSKRTRDPWYGKCKPSEGKGKSVFLLERQQEQNEIMGFGLILDCDLSRKQKEKKKSTTFIMENK